MTTLTADSQVSEETQPRPSSNPAETVRVDEKAMEAITAIGCG